MRFPVRVRGARPLTPMPHGKRRRSYKSKTISTSPRWCALCGLPIPAEVVSPNHPLYGTVDHLRPLAEGGKDSHTNRVAAHNWCNTKKSRKLKITAYEIESWRQHIEGCLEALGKPVKRADVIESRKRSVVRPVYPHSYFNFRPPREIAVEIQRWEDDGGTSSESALVPLIHSLRGQWESPSRGSIAYLELGQHQNFHVEP
jgi:hypothetical protein